jgi:hypothetical protein
MTRNPQPVRVETQSRSATRVEVAFLLFGAAFAALGTPHPDRRQLSLTGAARAERVSSHLKPPPEYR